MKRPADSDPAANVIPVAAAEPSIRAGVRDAALSDIESKRAAENIAEWRKYLPQDCVDTMVKHGWHRIV